MLFDVFSVLLLKHPGRRMSDSEAGETVETTGAAFESKSEVREEPTGAPPRKESSVDKIGPEIPNATVGKAKSSENNAAGSDPERAVVPDAAGSENGAAAEGKSTENSATPEEKRGKNSAAAEGPTPVSNAPTRKEIKSRKAVLKAKLKSVKFTGHGGDYKGDIDSGIRHGKGKLVWTGGNSYEGGFKNVDGLKASVPTAH